MQNSTLDYRHTYIESESVTKSCFINHPRILYFLIDCFIHNSTCTCNTITYVRLRTIPLQSSNTLHCFYPIIWTCCSALKVFWFDSFYSHFVSFFHWQAAILLGFNIFYYFFCFHYSEHLFHCLVYCLLHST